MLTRGQKLGGFRLASDAPLGAGRTLSQSDYHRIQFVGALRLSTMAVPGEGPRVAGGQRPDLWRRAMMRQEAGLFRPNAHPPDRMVSEAGRCGCGPGRRCCGRRRSPALSSLPHQFEIRVLEFLPFGHDHHGIGTAAAHRRAARHTSADRRSCARTLSIASGSCTCKSNARLEQPVDQRQRRCLADVVGARLERQAPDGDVRPANCPPKCSHDLVDSNRLLPQVHSVARPRACAARRRRPGHRLQAPARLWESNFRRSRRRETGTRSRCGCRGRCRGARR